MYKLAGFDDCVVGLVTSHGCPDRICYDLDLMIDSLAKQEDITRQSAYQFLLANLIKADMGPEGPIFLESADMKEIEMTATRIQFNYVMKDLH